MSLGRGRGRLAAVGYDQRPMRWNQWVVMGVLGFFCCLVAVWHQKQQSWFRANDAFFQAAEHYNVAQKASGEALDASLLANRRAMEAGEAASSFRRAAGRNP